ncbi:Hypothetical predicted protein [Paramuricea clavata]|uniref:Uncharacterized protein n=1 Tax=Paramuricea clavata TaxID=317549 RepID=A0A6S7GE19_PARCT|nr:Hypothetical predicted protein [Paramuricea clavata]
MSRNRYEEILSILHFNNNEEAVTDPADPKYDKLFKVKPLADHFRHVFKGSVTPETMQAIDEMMIPFKGRHSAKQYMPKKPTKWGYKLWCQAGMSGYVYDLEILGSPDAKGPPPGVDVPNLGESSNVILRLTKDVERKKHQLFFDNFFSCPELLAYLKLQDIFAVATLKANRSRGCPISTEKTMRKRGRGDIAQFSDVKAGLVICAWYDNRRVLTISNFLGKNPVSNCKRFDRKTKKDVSVPRPACIELYNKFMGGVDKADMLLSLYRTKHRSKKWYHRIAFHLISLAAVNAFVLYREVGGEGSLVDFLVDICRCLLVESQDLGDSSDDEATTPLRQRSLRANQVPTNIRHDRCNHWPLQCEKPQRCKWTVVSGELDFCAQSVKCTFVSLAQPAS